MIEEKIYKEKKANNSVILPGDPHGLPDDFFEVVVFIDNAYLIRLKNYFFREKFSYSVKNFVELLTQKNKLVARKIYLYDAPPFQSLKPDKRENKMKENYDRFISFFVREGIVVREGRTQRLKVDGSFIYKQKGVDMLLGIDAVGILNQFPNLKKIILLTGDSDFVPVVDKLKEIGVETILITYFDRVRKSSFSRCNDLIKSCSKWIMLTKEDFLEASNE